MKRLISEKCDSTSLGSKFLFLIGLIVIGLVLTSCQSFTKKKVKKEFKTDFGESPPELIKAYQKASDLMDKEDYELAITKFKEINNSFPSNPMTMILWYNTGAAYEGLAKCKSAGKNFRKVVRATNHEHPRIQAQALVRLSYSYECLGADKRVAATLIDARNREKLLEAPIGKAEVPARLASAFGRLGNFKEAQKYFKEADSGLFNLRNRKLSGADQRDALARSMFYMGRFWFKGFHIKNSYNILTTFEYAQKYLLKAVELDSTRWSALAAKNLVEVYDFMIRYMNHVKKTGKVRKYQTKKGEVTEMAVLIHQGLVSLRLDRLPDRKPPPLVSSLFTKVDQYEKTVSDFLVKNHSGYDLSMAEQERQGLRGKGRTFNPDPSLEARQERLKLK